MLGAALAIPFAARAQTTLSAVRFTCEFRMYGITAPWFYGLDAGYFRNEGIAGSAEAITRVAALDERRLKDGLTLVAEGFGLPGVPPVSEI